MVGIAAFLWCVAGLLALAVLAIAFSLRASATRLVYSATFGLCAVMFTLAARHLIGGYADDSKLTLPLGLPWIGAHFRLDALAAFFLIVVNFGGAAASLYGLGYGRHESAPHRVLPFFAAFLAGMNLVVLASDAFSFLLSWEFMSLASWALVIAHHREQASTRAGYIYLVMASAGTFALLLAFALLAGPTGAFTFSAIKAAHPTPLIEAVVLGLMLVGAGSKAGLVPLHVWLPLAHPAAPSHVSALMSGVMTKVAVYAFIRVVFDLMGHPTWWASLIVLFLGALSAVLGILHAMMENDLKRLLAYSTIENIGIIFVSLGLALAFKANGMPLAAALSLTAALFHVLNHSFFKSLLFFGAGAVLTATGERDIEKLGGLIHKMPLTSAAFLAGSVAISALPPFNGFVSEWLAFQAILLSPELHQWGLKIMVPAVGGLLALSAALAAATFVKAFGITFLGRPRSLAAEAAHEVDGFSLTVMLTLALLCLLAGILPGLIIDALAPVTRALMGSRMPVQLAQAWLTTVPIAESRSSYNGLLVFLFIVMSAALAAFAIHNLASRALRRGPAWGCGFPDMTPMAQYTGTSLAEPIRRVLGSFAFKARETVEMPPPGALEPARLRVEMHDLIWETLYQPLAGVIEYAATKLNHLQFLTIRRYLTLVFGYLVFLLLVLAIWP